MLIIDTVTLDEKADSLSDSEIYWTYNALDCCVTHEVYTELAKQVDEISAATYETSMATLAPVLEMVLEGLPVSETRREEVSGIYRGYLTQLEKGWQRLCVEGLGLPADRTKRKGRTPLAVSYSSPKDVQFLFHQVLGIPEKKMRKKGQDEAKVTTDRAVLEGFKTYYHAEPFVNYILAMRDATKALGFLKSPLSPASKLHCSLNVAGTNTGRLSSSFADDGTGTNLQNISGKLKDTIVAEPGYSIVDIDLEQGDSRGVAAIAWNWFVEEHGEAWAGSYLDACESGDLHTTVTRMAWPELSWGEDQKGWKKVANALAYRDLSFRDLAKKLGHGTNYMGLAATMAGHAKLPVVTVSDFQKAYGRAFPCIPAWQQETIRQLETFRMLTTPFGRRRYFWGDPKANSTRNAAIAYSPQSTTGEFINRGAIQLWHYRNARDLPIRLLLQVHDSLVLMVKTSQLEQLIPVILQQLKVKLILLRGREFTIPHGVKVGWNYGRYHERDNPYGLKSWEGSEERKAPKRLDSLFTVLNTPIGALR